MRDERIKMGIKDFVKSGVGHNNSLVRIYFICGLGWLGLLILADFIFVFGAIQDIKYGVISIVELLYILLVLTFIGLVPLLPLWFVDINKIGSKKKEEPAEEPKIEAEKPKAKEPEPKSANSTIK